MKTERINLLTPLFCISYCKIYRLSVGNSLFSVGVWRCLKLINYKAHAFFY
nr:MAG TPA: hypothetical protein [Caudoviricetes sp.]